MDDPEFHKRQYQIESRLVSAMVEATPASWDEIILDVVVNQRDGVLSMTHEISTPRISAGEVVSATPEIHDASFELFSLHNEHRSPWKSVRCIAKSDGKRWLYHAEFSYLGV